MREPRRRDRHLAAAGYARVSTANQAEHGFSLDEQERLLREFIDAQGMTCAEVYIDRGISGRRADKRPALQQMLSAAEAGKFDTLVIPSLDRLGRNAGDLHAIFKRLETAGVTIKSLRGDVDTSGATGRLLTGVMASLAEFESDVIGERTRIGKAASAAKGFRNGGGKRPFGYTKGRAPSQVPDEVAVLREARDRYVTGTASLSRIAADLNRRGIRSTDGAQITQSRLSQWFNNRFYCGHVKHLGVESEGQHDAVFSEAEWDELQAMLASKRARPGRGQGRTPSRFLLPGGVGRCPCCGGAIWPKRTTNSQGRVYELYVCGGKRSGASPDCTMPSFHREAVDEAILAYFSEVALDVEETRRRFAAQIESALTQTQAALDHAEREHAKAEGRLKRVRRAFQDDQISARDWNEQREELEAERDAAAAEVERLRQRAADVAAEGERLDATEEVLRYLTELRAAVANRVRDAASLDGIRAALLRVVDGFTFHPLAQKVAVPEEPPPLPEGWVRSRDYAHPELLVAGRGGLLLEPHPRRKAVLDPDKEIAFPELRRVALDARVRTTASSR